MPGVGGFGVGGLGVGGVGGVGVGGVGVGVGGGVGVSVLQPTRGRSKREASRAQRLNRFILFNLLFVRQWL